jgi:hypothetical protein
MQLLMLILAQVIVLPFWILTLRMMQGIQRRSFFYTAIVLSGLVWGMCGVGVWRLVLP